VIVKHCHADAPVVRNQFAIVAIGILNAITGLKTSFHESFIGLILSSELDTSVIPIQFIMS
jgi:hypothetical protein